MARTIAEIKDSMTADLMRNPDVARAYGFETGAAFSSHFSKVSVESLLFYIVACAIWVLENLFDQHRRDVEQRIEAIIPHRPKWYRDKVLGFMKDKTLVPDTDHYDTSGMNDGDIGVCACGEICRGQRERGRFHPYHQGGGGNWRCSAAS